MASKIKIDGIDKIIIKRLVEDARTPILSIAREVGISGAAIHQRLRKLENSDLMAGSKLIATAQTREEAINKMKRALDEFIIEGVKTTIPFHQFFYHKHGCFF